MTVARQWTVELDRAGIGAILRGPEARAMVNSAAARVASNITLPDVQGMVEVRPYTTDRGAAAVNVLHPRAVGLQAKHGFITAAAAAAGLPPLKAARR